MTDMNALFRDEGAYIKMLVASGEPDLVMPEESLPFAFLAPVGEFSYFRVARVLTHGAEGVDPTDPTAAYWMEPKLEIVASAVLGDADDGLGFRVSVDFAGFVMPAAEVLAADLRDQLEPVSVTAGWGTLLIAFDDELVSVAVGETAPRHVSPEVPMAATLLRASVHTMRSLGYSMSRHLFRPGLDSQDFA